jgi:hypothetical protein
MIKVVKILPEANIVLMSSLRDSDRVGVEFQDGTRSFVVRVKNGMYITCYPTNNYGHGNKTSGDTIEALLDKLSDASEIFVFDSDKELGQWLVENL